MDVELLQVQDFITNRTKRDSNQLLAAEQSVSRDGR
jgi:hypothetical protein